MNTEVLRQVPLFAPLADHVLAVISDELIEIDLPRGSSVFREGDHGDLSYFVITGRIKLGRAARSGRKSLIAVLGPGEPFGGMALFDPGARTETATAISDSRLVGFRNKGLRMLLDTQPDVSMELLRAFSQRQRRASETLASLVFSNVGGRVAKALLDLADRFGRPGTDGWLVEHDLTQEELAQFVGASRETVNRALAGFAQRGWVRLETRAVVILNFPHLRQRSH